MSDLPEGLTLIDSLDDDCLTYEFYEDPENPKESAICEFVVRPDRCVEIASGGAPGVPAKVLRFIASEADRLKFLAVEADRLRGRN